MSVNKFVAARIPPQDFVKAEKLIRDGRYINISDLLRRALREKLDREEATA